MKIKTPRQANWVKKALPITIVLMLSITAIAGNAATQILRWERFWGGSRDEWGRGISVSGENIYVSGQSMSFGAGKGDAVILKYDLCGTLIHDTTWGGSEWDVGHNVHVSDGNVYVAGTTWSFGYQNAFLLKFDSDCNLLWDRLWGYPSYGGYDNFLDVFVVGDDVYCVGDSEIGWGNPQLLLQKYDTYGNLQWSRLWGPIGSNVHTSGWGITVSGNDIYVVGNTESTPGPVGPYEALIQKYDTSGNLIWSRTWGGSGGDFAYDVSVLGNDVYVVGSTNSYGVGGDDIFLLKYDSAANLIWYKTWGGSKEDLGYEICISNGHIYVAGTTKSFGAGGYDAVTLKTDLSGNPIWYETWGGTADDEAHSIYVADNEIYVAGDTTSFGSGGKDIFLSKYAEVITATIDIDPDTLNLKSHGQWITAYIELPEGYNVEDIDLDTMKLCHHDFWLPAVTDPKYDFVTDPNVYMVDHDGDGYIDRLVKFDRKALVDHLEELNLDEDEASSFYDVTLMVKGEISGGPIFEGSETVHVRARALSVETTDSTGDAKDEFRPEDHVYIKGSGYSFSTIYNLYVIEDTAWIEDMDIPERVPDTESSVTTDEIGDIPVGTVAWKGPLTPGKYDIIIDVNGNGKYDDEVDALDDEDIEVTAGFFVIPEFPLGTIMGLGGFIVALGIFKSKIVSRNIHYCARASNISLNS